MSKIEKLLDSIRNNPKGVRFDDACKVAESLGFSYKRVHGSHHIYGRLNEPVILNFQNKNGSIAFYQVKQLIEVMNKYE